MKSSSHITAFVGSFKIKRILDILISCILLPFVFPLCILAALAVWLECKASPFFLQDRLGRNEVHFRILKIRTMHVDTIQAASHEVQPEKILTVGRFLRATKIDELPQLWNVIKGDMSLVGPRPGLPGQWELIEARRKYRVYEMKPGITGISQISGIDMSTPWELAKHDASYNKTWALAQDLKILWSTLIGKGSGDAVKINSEK